MSANLTLRALGRLSGVAASTISNMEGGHQYLSAKNADRLGTALGLSLVHLKMLAAQDRLGGTEGGRALLVRLEQAEQRSSVLATRMAQA